MIFEEWIAYKYVRLDADEFRFSECYSGGGNHINLVKEGEKAISAGLIGVRPNEFSIIMEGSQSLKINSSMKSDIPLLEKIINKPFKEESY
jgi:hypothetical protein